MFCIIDCNNFYASCERLFRPDLRNRPIVVLSNNDGCCIARSNEAKALGIGMGEPYFKLQALCKQHEMAVFSSNYTLYGDISQRVMQIIEETWPYVEIYSIDEAFLDLSSLSPHLHVSFCESLQRKIFKEVGIPTSIGIGPTKTLAKAANFLCKKILNVPVFKWDECAYHLLKLISVKDIWGVGRQWSEKLINLGIHTAYDLKAVDPHRFRKQFTVVLMRTIFELQGMACSGIEEPEPRQNIMSSKSFSQMQTELEPISQAISAYCARAVEKCRHYQLIAQKLSVFVHTNRHRLDLKQHYQCLEVKLIHPTDDIRILTRHAKALLAQMYKPGYYYKKAGVYLQGLMPKTISQEDMFDKQTSGKLYQKEQLMSVYDAINRKYGRGSLRLAAEGYYKPWSMKAELKSPAYTTRWSDVPKVRA